MTNIYWNIKQNSKKSFYHARTFFLQSFITKDNFYKFHCKNQKQPPDEFGKNVFLEILQNSQERTCARASFFIKLQV